MDQTERQMREFIEEAIENGVEFLDASMENWWNKIDLKLFEINDCKRCVLGQTLGWEIVEDWNVSQCAEHGFDWYIPSLELEPYAGRYIEYLGKCWREKILQLREERNEG